MTAAADGNEESEECHQQWVLHATIDPGKRRPEQVADHRHLEHHHWRDDASQKAERQHQPAEPFDHGDEVRDHARRGQVKCIADVEIGARTVAVVQFAGDAKDENLVAQNRAKLLAWIERRGWTATSEPEFAGYNAPIIPGPLRRNELWIEVSGTPREADRAPYGSPGLRIDA